MNRRLPSPFFGKLHFNDCSLCCEHSIAKRLWRDASGLYLSGISVAASYAIFNCWLSNLFILTLVPQIFSSNHRRRPSTTVTWTLSVVLSFLPFCRRENPPWMISKANTLMVTESMFHHSGVHEPLPCPIWGLQFPVYFLPRVWQAKFFRKELLHVSHIGTCYRIYFEVFIPTMEYILQCFWLAVKLRMLQNSKETGTTC